MELDTFPKQKAYFEQRWPQLREAAEQHGVSGLVDAIKQMSDPLERRVLFMFARQGLLATGWLERFDLMIGVADAGQRELLAEIEAATTDDETRSKRRHALHSMLFNLAADLAECWPDDPDRRQRHHFEKGRDTAVEALRINDILNSPASTYANDWWIRGVHEWSLHAPECLESLATAVRYAKEQAAADGASSDIGAKAPYTVLCFEGYHALAAQWQQPADAGATERYEHVCAAFEAQMADEATRGDAEFGLAQLRFVKQRFVDEASS